MKRIFFFALAFLFTFSVHSAISAQTKFYRGTVGGKNVEMKLTRAGDQVTGTYSYDAIGGSLTVKGSFSGDKITLSEYDSTTRMTGKFEGSYVVDNPTESVGAIAGTWKSAKGKTEFQFSLTEQPIEFTNGLVIKPKYLNDKRDEVRVSIPQLTGTNSKAVTVFNTSVNAMLMKDINEYKSIPPERGKSYYEGDYQILLATNDLVSFEINASAYSGGAHPWAVHFGMTYDMKAGREIKFEELFKAKSNYKDVLFNAAKKRLNERFKQEGMGEDEIPIEREQIDNLVAWGMSRKGVVIYLPFPHVAEAFSRVFIPFSDLKTVLNPNGPAMMK